uniref:RNA helicase n=1 Tax=Meloidogyne hapla TaxID=6305 RepID=A0A1I8AZW3_MELHA
MEYPCQLNLCFRDIGVATWLTRQLEELNLRHPTPVQANCIPKILYGSDVLGCAKTGTGKTLAFVLPILQELSTDPFGIFALVLTPTRELAFQIGDQFICLGKQMNLKCSIIVGGRHQLAQAQELVRRPHIVIATPGCIHNYRFIDAYLVYVVKEVNLVVNHNVPRCPKSYLHRVGRSARAGRFGAAVTFVTQHDVFLLRAIEKIIGGKMEQMEVPHQEVALYAAKVLSTKREAEIRLENQDNNSDERKENWRRKELFLQGMDEKLIDKEISHWKDNRKSKQILRTKNRKRRLNP